MAEPAARTAPAFPPDVEWIGTDLRPGFDDALAGRVVVLLLFTDQDVFCEDALADLAWCQLRFAAEPVAVLGAFTPRRDAPADRRRVAALVDRLGLRFPVALDLDRRVFEAWGATAWPTLALVDPSGAVRFQGAGVPSRDRLVAAIDSLAHATHAVAPPLPPIAWSAAAARRAHTDLVAPTGIAIDPHDGIVWVADTGRHRLFALEVETGAAEGGADAPLRAALRHVVGTGRPGCADGDPSFASFQHPRGIAVHEGRVFVADTGNHLVRLVDLDQFGVTTVLGVGRAVPDVVGGSSGVLQGIASPRGLDWHDGSLWVAMAGTHQVWRVGVDDGYAEAFAGSGDAGGADGMRHDATFAQPIDCAAGAGQLAVIDGASGAVRIAEPSGEAVWTVVEAGADGAPRGPAAVVWCAGQLWIADARGDRILAVDVATREVREVLGPDAGLAQPSGLAVHPDGAVWIADTGNRRLLRFDPTSGALRTIEIVDPHPEAPPEPHPSMPVRAASVATLCFPLQIPAGERLHPEVEGRAWVRALEGSAVVEDTDGPLAIEGTWAILADVPTGAVGPGVFEILVRYATCADLDGVAHIQELHGRFEVEGRDDAPDVLDLPLGS